MHRLRARETKHDCTHPSRLAFASIAVDAFAARKMATSCHDKAHQLDHAIATNETVGGAGMQVDVMDAPPTNADQELMARLERPDTAAALNQLLDRLEVIVLAADAADSFLRRGDVLTESVADGLS
jgi:hypothetical protein